jgi:hypothetical protein
MPIGKYKDFKAMKKAIQKKKGWSAERAAAYTAETERIIKKRRAAKRKRKAK